MKDFKFNFRCDDIEVRICKNKDSFFPEVVKWISPEECKEGDYPSCYTLCYWKQDKDDYWELMFVENRPFDEFNNGFPKEVWNAMKFLDNILNIKNDKDE